MKWNELSMDEDLLKQNVEDFEKHIIVSALLRTHGNQSLAAKQLGTTTRVIAYRVQKYNIDLEQFHDKNRKKYQVSPERQLKNTERTPHHD
jgi:transcriptional regulator with GAF, ATPase, and Fis domain